MEQKGVLPTSVPTTKAELAGALLGLWPMLCALHVQSWPKGDIVTWDLYELGKQAAAHRALMDAVQAYMSAHGIPYQSLFAHEEAK